MSETTTTKKARTTTYATGVAKGKRITKTKAYSVAEVADLCDVSIHTVLRWINLGYVQTTKQSIEGSKRSAHQITGGEALADFFALRKQHSKEVAARRSEREAKAAARAATAAEPTEGEQPAA